MKSITIIFLLSIFTMCTLTSCADELPQLEGSAFYKGAIKINNNSAQKLLNEIKEFADKHNFAYSDKKTRSNGDFYIIQLVNKDYGVLIVNPFEELVFKFGFYQLNEDLVNSKESLIAAFQDMLKDKDDYEIVSSGFLDDNGDFVKDD